MTVFLIVSGHLKKLESQLAENITYVPLFGGDQKSGPHDQRHRVLNYSLRKITKTRAAFPTEEGAIKLLWLGLQNAAKKWTMPIRNWGAVMNQFAIMFEDRRPIPRLTGNSFTRNS